jgi:hypothetical protein
VESEYDWDFSITSTTYPYIPTPYSYSDNIYRSTKHKGIVMRTEILPDMFAYDHA